MFVNIFTFRQVKKYNCLFNKILDTKDPFHKKTDEHVTCSKCLLTFNICHGAYGDINGP